MLSIKNPEQYRAEEKLANGQVLTIRAIRPDDKQALQDGIKRLGHESIYLRFFQSKVQFTAAELAYLTEVDFVSHVALGASVKTGEKDLAVGVARYIVTNRLEKQREAEVAFVVDDAYQGLGIARLLLKHLMYIARAGDIQVFTAHVLFENKKMIAVFEHAGLPLKTRIDDEGYKISLMLQ